MKVLFVASPSSFTSQVHQAFLENGAEVIYLDDRLNMVVPSFLRKNNFLWKLVRKIRPLKVLSNKLFNDQIIKVAKSRRPELAFFIKGLIVTPETLKTLNQLGVKTANWFIENTKNEPYLSWFRHNHSKYDFFFHFDSSYARPESPNVYYMPLAVDPEIYQAKLSESDLKKYQCDVCFVGAHYPEREKFLSEIKDLDLRIYGWPKGWSDSALANKFFGPLNATESAKAYQAAKICVNVNLRPEISGANLKTFEILAAGGFELSDYRKDLENLFEIGSEIAVFKNDEFRKQILSYLDIDDSKREALAKHGQARVLRDHTMIQRVKQMFEIINHAI